MTLDELRRLEREATKGPWKEHGSCRSIQARCFDGTWKIVADRIRGGTPGQAHANRRLLVALRNAAPVLLEVAEKAKAYRNAYDKQSEALSNGDEAEQLICSLHEADTRADLFAAVEKMEGM